jgi:RecB family endonuclease NucS
VSAGLKVLIEPSLQEASKIIVNALRRRELVIIIGDCMVNYSGRSRSILTRGERLVIIKEDGSLLIHRPEGYKPVNWQPETTTIHVVEENGKLIIKAVRGKPREVLEVSLFKIKLLYTDHLSDQGIFEMYLDEHEIRDIISLHPEIIEDGLRITEKEKPVTNGYIDLFGYDAHNRPVIIELKRVTAGREAVLQLYNYVKDIARKTGSNSRGILVAPRLTQNAIRMLRSLGLEWREISIQKLWEKYGRRKKENLTLERFVG